MTHTCTTAEQLSFALKTSQSGDVIVAHGDLHMGKGPYYLNDGVRLIGAECTLRFTGELSLRDSECCLNVVPGPKGVHLTNINIIVQPQKGILCAPFGYAGKQRGDLPLVTMTNCTITAASDCLYFQNCKVRFQAAQCQFTSHFDIVYVPNSSSLDLVQCTLQWLPDPALTGNVCISWGFVGGDSTLRLNRCHLDFIQQSQGDHPPKGLTYLSTNDVVLTKCTFDNPNNLPIVNVLGVSGLKTGRFVLK